MTRLDRIEPTLNDWLPGDLRDTTTPRAMLGSAEGDGWRGPPGLPPASSRLARHDTIGERLRAGLPPGWRVGDKTGSGDHGTANVVAIIRRSAARR